jgi:hypothetical protein
MKFQHFIRSQKRRTDNGLRDNAMQWDFWTLSPESAHQVTWLMGHRDRLVSNVAGHLKKGVSQPVLLRAFEYWRKIDKEIGDRIAAPARFAGICNQELCAPPFLRDSFIILNRYSWTGRPQSGRISIELETLRFYEAASQNPEGVPTVWN